MGTWRFLLASRFVFFAALSALSQHHFSEALKRREVLLKLLGAERLLANGLCLLLNGVAIVSQTGFSGKALADFVEHMSPPTLVCCILVCLRRYALTIGLGLALYPHAERLILPWLDYGGAFVGGLILGAMIIGTLGREYLTSARNLEASHAMRLCYLLPGEVSDKAAAFLDSMVSRVRTRTVQMFAVSVLERIFRFLLR